MASFHWPTDTRPLQNHAVQKGKSKARSRAHWQYPLLSEGALNSVSLHRKDEFHWTNVSGDNGKRVKADSSSVVVFPATRSYKKEPAIRSVVQQAEASANFIRKVYPDIDVPTEVIRDEITQDAGILQEKANFDPAEGNTLQAIFHDDGTRKRSAVLAFPMGDTRTQLNVSPFNYSGRETPVFKPNAKPAWSFSAPIQQISAPNSVVQSRVANLFAVRTMGTTNLFRIQANSDSGPRIDQLSEMSSSSFADRPLADIQISEQSSGALALAVDDRGSIYEVGAGEGHSDVFHIYKNPENMTATRNDDPFWNLACHHEYSHCYIVSKNSVRSFDSRTQAFTSNLWMTSSPGVLTTSAEMPKSGYLSRVVTTREILWIDERFPGKPVIGVNHWREFDRTLDICTLNLASTQLTFLTSLKTGLISIYDVSRGEDQLTHLNAPPYALSPIVKSAGLPVVGHSIFQHPHGRESHFEIYHMSSHGALFRLNARFSGEVEATNLNRGDQRLCHWDHAVKELDSISKHLTEDIGPLGEREYSKVDLAPAYEYVFLGQGNRAEEGEIFYDTLERIPKFWQESDVPTDHILTTFDMAFRSGEEPLRASRADFLTQSAINSRRGFRALKQGALKPELLAKNSMWHHDLTATLKLLDHDISDDAGVMLEQIRGYNLSIEVDRTTESLKQEMDGCEKLALDLGLSANVYSGKRFSKPTHDKLEEAMETMSLAASVSSSDGKEPPPVHFGFLSPVRKRHYARGGGADEQDTKEELTPAGVRLLVNDWVIGTDPKDYVYEDPYKDDALPKTAHYPTRMYQPPPISQSQPQNQRPPPIATVNPVAPPTIIQQVRKPAAQTQDVVMGFSQPNKDVPESSQPMMVSTQVVPGPFGGRAAAAKKKPAKKRVGGF